MSEFVTPLFDSLWIPAARSVPRSAQKLMIILHGRGDSLRAFRNIKSEIKLPHLNYLVLNGPRKYHSGYTWCALDPQPRSPSLLVIRARLFALVKELKAAGWRSRDILWMGHSQGCLVASDVVLNHSDSFAGLVGVSGYVWLGKGWRAKLARSRAAKTPWLMTHGSRDRIIRPDEFRADIARLLTGPVRLEYRIFEKGHDFDFADEVPFIREWISAHP